jgi:hypothetical protein
MKVELNPEEMDLVVDALDANHASLPNNADNLPKVRAINVLYNRLTEHLNVVDQEKTSETLGLQL